MIGKGGPVTKESHITFYKEQFDFFPSRNLNNKCKKQTHVTNHTFKHHANYNR